MNLLDESLAIGLFGASVSTEDGRSLETAAACLRPPAVQLRRIIRLLPPTLFNIINIMRTNRVAAKR